MEEISRSRPCVRKSRIYSALPINVGWWKNFPTSYSTYWSQVHKQSGGLSRDGTTTPNNVHQGPLIPSTSATNPEKCCSRCKARPFEHKAIRRGRGLGSSQSQFIMQQSSSTVGAGIIAIAIHHAAAAAQCVPPRVHHAPAVKVDPRTLHKYLVQESTLVSSHPFFIEGGTFRWGLNLVDPISKCTTSARRAAQPASQPASHRSPSEHPARYGKQHAVPSPLVHDDRPAPRRCFCRCRRRPALHHGRVAAVGLANFELGLPLVRNGPWHNPRPSWSKRYRRRQPRRRWRREIVR